MKKAIFFIEKQLKQQGWVIAFILACLIGWERNAKKQQIAFEELKQKQLWLQKEKETALLLKQDLLQQINSQSDPAWIELTLMRVLGLVPEGQIKVYFPPHDD